MIVKKKAKWYDWYIAFMAMMLIQGLIIVLGDTIIVGDDSALMDMLLVIVCNFILIISVYFSVWIITEMRYDKGCNFYTSPRFRYERKVAILIGIFYFILVLIVTILGIRNAIIGIVPLNIEFIGVLAFLFGLVPIATLFTFYIIYMYAFIGGLRNPYYDDSLD